MSARDTQRMNVYNKSEEKIQRRKVDAEEWKWQTSEVKDTCTQIWRQR